MAHNVAGGLLKINVAYQVHPIPPKQTPNTVQTIFKVAQVARYREDSWCESSCLKFVHVQMYSLTVHLQRQYHLTLHTNLPSHTLGALQVHSTVGALGEGKGRLLYRSWDVRVPLMGCETSSQEGFLGVYLIYKLNDALGFMTTLKVKINTSRGVPMVLTPTPLRRKCWRSIQCACR